jgi:hypothetical protein
MAIRDNELIFATTTAPTTTNICLATNILDVGPLADGTFPTGPYSNLGRDLGGGEPMYLEIDVTVSALSATTASLISFEWVTASSSALSSFTVLARSASFSSTDLKGTTTTTGPQTRILLPLPADLSNYRRYVGVNCNITLGILSALTYSAYLVKQPNTYVARAPGFKIVT